ncbi:glycosyltransferase family 4 protein [Prosthecobacter debontii]|nr:glycosyltransferase family 4 protein [Prosthecobacter debontii]
MLNPDAVIAWHGMAELPVILHSIPRGCRHVGVHGGNPASNLSSLTDLRYLFTEGLVFPRRCNPVYLCCSQYVADTFKRSYYLNRFQTKVVANGVYDVPDSLKHIPRIIPTNGSKVVIGMLARLDLIKDHATVIRAFAEIKREFPCAVLELAGDGDQAQNLRALTEALGLVDSVHFLGTVRQVTEVIRKWDVCVYATTHNEGFGIALAEGLMAGLPTVVTDVGPIREVCGNVEGATVIYVKPGSSKQLAEAVTRLIPDLKSRQALSLMARQHAMRHLSGRTFAKRYIQLLFPAIIFADA